MEMNDSAALLGASDDEMEQDSELDPAIEDAEPGEDIPVAPYDGLSVVSAIKQCFDESEEARRTRDQLNKVNYDASHCRQDLSAKVRGQSAEFLPMVPMALEQLAAFIKRGLVAFGNWFQVELSPDPALATPPGQPDTTLTASGIMKLMKHRLEAPEEIVPGCLDFPTTVADGVKTGALGSLVVLKVHGQHIPTRRLSVDLKHIGDQTVWDPITQQAFQQPQFEEEMTMVEGKVWRLLIELVRPEDYYPDPTGRGLYEIHRTRKDLHEVIEAAESGDYDPEAVAELSESYVDYEVDREIERETDQPKANAPSFRKQVELLEFWGTLLDSDGNVAHRNVRCTIANEKYLIRRPEPNPYWHQESPFVVAPLLRVPFSVFHKGLFDNAVRLNLASNEIFNLIVDGGIGSVWGVREVQPDLIDNWDDFTDGIPQGATILKKAEAAQDVPVFRNTPGGVVPPEAMGVFQLLKSEFNSATKLNDVQLGQIPKKDVRATEISAAEQSSSIFFDSVIGDLEQSIIKKALRLAWLVMLQNCDDWSAEDVVGCIGPTVAQSLAQMSAARRYVKYAQGCRFRVNGLSSILARTREFQKTMAAVAAIQQSPILAQAFMKEASPTKLLHHLFKSINIDPEDLKISEEEQRMLPQTLQQLPFFQGMASGAQGNQQAQGDPSQQPGSPGQQAQAAASEAGQIPQGM